MLRAQTHSLLSRCPTSSWAVAALVLWFAINLSCLARFPTVFIDEAENGNHAYNAAFRGQAVFTLYDGLYPQRLYSLRQSWPPVIRPFYIRPLAFFIRRVGCDLVRLRLFSLCLGALALVALYRTGVLLGGPPLGLIAAGVAGVYFPFLYSSHSIRPEILLALSVIVIFSALLVGFDKNVWWAYLLAGCLTGMAPGIHTNGITFVLPVFVVIVLRRAWRGAFWVLVGGILGASFFISMADWDRFIPGYWALFFREFTTPPLIAVHGNVLQALAQEAERYVGPWIFGDWGGGLLFARLLAMEHLAFLGTLVWACRQPGRVRLVGTFGVALAVAYALLVGQKASNYLAVLAPFFALSAGSWIITSRDVRFSPEALEKRARAMVAGLTLAGWAVFGSAVLGTVAMVVSVSRYEPTFLTLASRLRARLPDQVRVAGPQELWLGLPSEGYRDIGALVWHRLLLNEKNLWKPLAQFHPDYVILDDAMRRRLARLSALPHQPLMRAPTYLFPWPHEVLDVMPTGKAYGGSWALIQFPKTEEPRR